MIATKCCKVILACGDCLSTWYSGPDTLTKSCPYCRAECGYAERIVIKGLLMKLREIWESDSFDTSLEPQLGT